MLILFQHRYGDRKSRAGKYQIGINTLLGLLICHGTAASFQGALRHTHLVR